MCGVVHLLVFLLDGLCSREMLTRVFISAFMVAIAVVILEMRGTFYARLIASMKAVMVG